MALWRFFALNFPSLAVFESLFCMIRAVCAKAMAPTYTGRSFRVSTQDHVSPFVATSGLQDERHTCLGAVAIQAKAARTITDR